MITPSCWRARLFLKTQITSWPAYMPVHFCYSVSCTCLGMPVSWWKRKMQLIPIIEMNAHLQTHHHFHVTCPSLRENGDDMFTCTCTCSGTVLYCMFYRRAWTYVDIMYTHTYCVLLWSKLSTRISSCHYNVLGFNFLRYLLLTWYISIKLTRTTSAFWLERSIPKVPKSINVQWKRYPNLLDVDGIGTVAMAWLYTQSWIRSSRWEFDGFGTHGYVLYSLGYTVEYWIHQNQAKPGEGFWRIWG